MFPSFTSAEVEQIRYVVIIGHHDNEQLLLNSTSRPLVQTKGFIRRFKRYLLDSQYSCSEIAEMANIQYSSIINSMRSKTSALGTKSSKNLKMSTKITNRQVFINSQPFSVPYRFKSKFVHISPPNESTIYTRSNETQPKSDSESTITSIPIIPPSSFHFSKAYKSIADVHPGQIAVYVLEQFSPPIFCRILAVRKINEEDYLLVSFFLKGLSPCYIIPQDLVPVFIHHTDNKNIISVSVDYVLEQIITTAQSQIYEEMTLQQYQISSQSQNQQSSTPFVTSEQVRSTIFNNLFICCSHLLLLSFASNWTIPPEKLEKLLNALSKINGTQFQSTKIIFDRCMNLIQKILGYALNESPSSSSQPNDSNNQESSNRSQIKQLPIVQPQINPNLVNQSPTKREPIPPPQINPELSQNQSSRNNDLITDSISSNQQNETTNQEKKEN